MIDALQSVAVAAANVVAPGSGALVNTGFELAKIACEIGEVLLGMKDKAAVIKTQHKTVEEDVDEFEHVVELLGRVQNQSQLTEKLQHTIVTFQKQVLEYDRVVVKLTKKSLIKQLIFRNELSDASAAAKKVAVKVRERLTTECSINASPTHRSNRVVRSVEDQRAEEDKRCMAFADSPEIIEELSDVDNQKDVLATLLRSRADDPVLRVIKYKVMAASSAAVRNEVNNLPSWYVAENDVKLVDAMKLGFGGDAKIYKAKHAGIPVAVKIYDINSMRDEKAKLRLVNTLNIWNRLRHTQICQFYGACYLIEKPFAVMEICDGGSLETFLRRDESTRPQVALEMLIQAANGMLRMHSLGIVHCDFKADNIVIDTATRTAKVCDFDRSFDWTALKTKRLVSGTAEAAGVEISEAVRWLAPECVEGKVPSSASDVYSFGMTIYEALTGEIPYFEINQDEEVKACILAHELPTRDVQRISDGAWELIGQCCEAEPTKRPTMETVLKSLRMLSLANRGTLEDDESEFESQTDSPMDVTMNDAVERIAVVSECQRPQEAEATDVERQIDASMGVTEPSTAVGLADVTVVLSDDSSADTKEPSDLTQVKSAKGRSRSTFWRLLLAAAALAIAAVVLGSVFGSNSTSSTATNSTSTQSPTLNPTDFQVSTIAGSGSSRAYAFTGLVGVAVASDGSIYLSDEHRLQRMMDGGEPSVYSGSLFAGNVNGLRANAKYYYPRAMAVSSSGDLFICDYGNRVVRKVTGGSTVSTISSDSFSDLSGIAVDSNGVVYFTSGTGNTVTKITSAGVTTSLATAGYGVMGVAVDSVGNLYITEKHMVKKISKSDGKFALIAGSSTSGFADGDGTTALFSEPVALVFGSDGNLYIADSGNHCIRKLTLATKVVTTFAGVCGSPGSSDGETTSARFISPRGIATSSNGSVLYVTDGEYSAGRLRKVSASSLS